MTEFASSPAATASKFEGVRAPEALTLSELLSGPAALPQAPLAMPPQVIEPSRGRLRRWISGLVPQPIRAHGRS